VTVAYRTTSKVWPVNGSYKVHSVSTTVKYQGKTLTDIQNK